MLESMQVSFALDRDDYLDFLKHANARVEKAGRIRERLSPLAWTFWILLLMSCIAFFFFLDQYGEGPANHLYAAVVLLLIQTVVFFLYNWRRGVLLMQYGLAPDGIYLASERLSIDVHGIHTEAEVFTQTVRWPAIKAVEKSKRQVFLFIDAAQALCIPRRAFESPEMEDEFLKFVNWKVDEAKLQSPDF